jgi:hypothetical protein
MSNVLPKKMRQAVAGYDRDLYLLKWMVGGLYVLGAPAMWLLLRVAAKVGALG